jgi:hypothetical protein
MGTPNWIGEGLIPYLPDEEAPIHGGGLGALWGRN